MISIYQDALGGALKIINNLEMITADIHNVIDGASLKMYNTEKNTTVDISNDEYGGYVEVNAHWSYGGASLNIDDKGHGVHTAYNRKGKDAIR